MFDTSFYKALYAKGQLRENALLSPTCLFVNFIIIYILFKLGWSPVALSWSTAISYAIMGLVIKPILLIKIVDYKWADIRSVQWSCLKVFVLSLIVPFGVSYYIKGYDFSLFGTFAIMVTVCLLSVACVVWFIGMTVEMRLQLLGAVKSKLHKK